MEELVPTQLYKIMKFDSKTNRPQCLVMVMVSEQINWIHIAIGYICDNKHFSKVRKHIEMHFIFE